jgi:sugar lactone lactonase YvrE
VAKPSIRPQVWRPPRAPAMDGAYAPNRLLAGLERLEVPGSGPEDVVVDHAGDVYTGTADGTILRLSADGRRIERVATTGGRPLGIEVAPDGRLVVCDAERGLLRLDPRTEVVETLLDAAAGVRLANNAAIGSDGSIYFSDSSQLFPLAHFKADLLEHSGTGRLLRRHPDGEVEPLLTGLQFANGVALAPDESFVLVAETGGYRVRRYWLTTCRGCRTTCPPAPAECSGWPCRRPATPRWTGCCPAPGCCAGPCGRCRTPSSRTRPGSPSSSGWPPTARSCTTSRTTVSATTT